MCLIVQVQAIKAIFLVKNILLDMNLIIAHIFFLKNHMLA
ncbi:hypothetical protein HMPREF9370_1538 [Neisseria wadsworthii 9715]|uniref:Uncharacterized protein n=1 Tax=Neisseria wadsworthii 9715 TaxID=1030841 RepID=G4CR28_9NEIS|nr:hypothetical protein HMPREF9370_1538 [Neisseria wadsworthii 9715]